MRLQRHPEAGSSWPGWPTASESVAGRRDRLWRCRGPHNLEDASRGLAAERGIYARERARARARDRERETERARDRKSDRGRERARARACERETELSAGVSCKVKTTRLNRMPKFSRAENAQSTGILVQFPLERSCHIFKKEINNCTPVSV